MLSDLITAHIALRTADTAEHLLKQILTLISPDACLEPTQAQVMQMSADELDALSSVLINPEIRELIAAALHSAYRAGIHDGTLRVADLIHP